MVHLDLLGDDDSQHGLWNSLTRQFINHFYNKMLIKNYCCFFYSSFSKGEADETLNIFSLASGHLYERFLRIMMLSVLKNTKTPVKFWFLKNYLSPAFKVEQQNIVLTGSNFDFFFFTFRIFYHLCLKNMNLSMNQFSTNGLGGYISSLRSSVSFGVIKSYFQMFCFL